jgi:hypothetical protein
LAHEAILFGSACSESHSSPLFGLSSLDLSEVGEVGRHEDCFQIPVDWVIDRELVNDLVPATYPCQATNKSKSHGHDDVFVVVVTAIDGAQERL